MDAHSLRDPLAQENEQQLLAALRAGDEDAFAALVDCYHASLVRLPRMYVRQRSVAEGGGQETGLPRRNGIDRFAGPSALKTWAFRDLPNPAKTRRGRRDRSR